MSSKARGNNCRCDTRRATNIANIALYWLALALERNMTKQNKVKTHAMRLLDKHYPMYNQDRFSFLNVLNKSKQPPLVAVKGAGDLATGVMHRLCRAGFAVMATELPQP